MTSTSRRAPYLLGSVVAAVLLALVIGALPYFQGASADTTRELVRVTFRPAHAKGVTGWRSDNGAAFDARRAYGWVRDQGRNTPTSMTDAAVSRTSRASRSDTFIAMQPPKHRWGRWVMAVAPGTYRVTVTVGDPSGSGARSTLAVENEKVIDNFQPTPAAPTRTGTVDVKVTDGRLTLDPLYPNRSTNTKLVSVVVSAVLGGDQPPTTQPPTTEPPVTLPPVTVPPVTVPPVTEPPTTQPPTTVPSGLGSQTGFGTGGAYMGESDTDINREFDGMAATGATWVRLPILWSSIEQSPGVYWWTRQEQVVHLAQQHGLKVIANVSYTPKWARPAGCADMKCPPADIDNYSRFMRQLVAHFSPLGVKTYEVWNEPNQSFWWKPLPSPARYAEMVTKADTQAHLADPNVTILAGVFAPSADNEAGTTISPATFLAGMYRAGATFDALSYHPYTQDLTDPRVNVAWNMITSIGPALHAIMQANGDGAKKIWATEYTYFTGTAHKAVSESDQARYMPLGVQAWRQQSWAGPLIFFTYRDMTDNHGELFDNGGLVHRDFTPKPALAVMRGFLTN